MKLTDYPFNEMATIIEGHIVVTDEDSGKVQKFALREMATATLGLARPAADVPASVRAG